MSLSQESSAPGPESLGHHLREARESRNVSLEQVAYATRISLKMLRALEENDFAALPAPTFVRGYLQAYGRFVRLDTDDLLLRYQNHLASVPDDRRGAIRSHYLYVRERYQEKRRLVLIIVLFAIMLSVAGAYFFLKAQREKHKRLAKTAEQIQKSEAPVPPAPAAPAARPAERAPEKTPERPADAKPPAAEPAPGRPAEPAPPQKPLPATPEPMKAPEPKSEASAAEAVPAPEGTEKKNYRLMLKATEDVWLRFQTDEDEVKDLTLRSGKAMLLKADRVIKIFSGNLGALKATWNGTEMPSLAAAKTTKSVVLPEAEAAKFKPPLFPQFQSASPASGGTAEKQRGAQAPPGTPAPVLENPQSPPTE